MFTLESAERLIRRIRACEDETAGIALLAAWTRETYKEALEEAAEQIWERWNGSSQMTTSTIKMIVAALRSSICSR